MHFKDFFKATVDHVEPVSAPAFSKMFFKFMALQVATIGLIYGVYRWVGLQDMRDMQYMIFVVVVLAESFLYRYFKKYVDYRGRLKELYPEQPLPSRMHVGLVTWTPFLFFPVMAHMMLARKNPQQTMPWFYRNQLSTLFTLFVAHFFVFGLAALRLPAAAALVSPSMSYMANLSNTVTYSLSAAERMKKSAASGQVPAFDIYFMNGELNSTKLVLGLAAYFGSVQKYSPRVPASEQENFRKASTQNLISYYAQWNPQKSVFADISFISLLTPAALVEASLITLINMVSSDVTAEKVFHASDEYMTKHEADPELLAALRGLPMAKAVEVGRQSRLLTYLKQTDF